MTRPIFKSAHLVIAACFSMASAHHASAFVTDPGFENYTVAQAGFTQATDGAWTFNIYTTGVTEPLTTEPSTIYDDTPRHFSATFAAYEGSQYISAYAGAGSFWQDVTLDVGEYELSVYAASPGGQIDLAHHEEVSPALGDLETGAFRFLFDGASVGPTFEPVLDAGWVRYSTTVEVSQAGSYTVGVEHQKIAPYFINYDMFQVTTTPEPGSLMAMSIAGLLLTQRRRRSVV